jgi:A/G-specific adenine glycosylase
MNKKEKMFIQTVWEHYERHGRRSLPWRKTKNPYRILVSEVMLQQTQVDRVIPKYHAFLKQFPTVAVLAEASLGDVLRVWQGLGYNRRARMLHECAKKVRGAYKGKFPKTHAELMRLPGIGHYTAGAVLAFAYGVPVPIIETNIRSVYIHHFHNDDFEVSDKEVMTCVEKTLDHERVRDWYYALMDYGVYIKKEFGNPNNRSKHYVKQSTFKGSDRQIRGAILRTLTTGEASRQSLHTLLSAFDFQRIDEQLEKLEREGMIQQKKKGIYSLPV